MTKNSVVKANQRLIMKKIIAIILLSTVTIGCKKEQYKKQFYLQYLELVLNEEKIGTKLTIRHDLNNKVDEIEAIYLGKLNVASVNTKSCTRQDILEILKVLTPC